MEFGCHVKTHCILALLVDERDIPPSMEELLEVLGHL